MVDAGGSAACGIGVTLCTRGNGPDVSRGRGGQGLERGRQLEHAIAGGGNAFFEYQVPSAVITLKQGFGRLIRSLHDRGLLALLDTRILKKQYGRVFIESLPPYTRTTDLKKVEQFFGHDLDL